MRFGAIRYMASCGLQSAVFVSVAITFTLIAWLERSARVRVADTKNILNQKRLSPAGQNLIKWLAAESGLLLPAIIRYTWSALPRRPS